MSEPARSPSSLELDLPEGALVVLVGPSGSGKSTFARKHFLATEIISSDFCRGLVGDDESDQTASKDAFDVLRFVTEKRLGAGRLTVVDATSVRSEHRAALLALATRHRARRFAPVNDSRPGRGREEDDEENVSVGSAFGVPFPLPGLGGDGWSARPNHPSPRENLVTTRPPRPPAPRRRERPAPSLSCLPSSSRGQRGALRSRYC